MKQTIQIAGFYVEIDADQPLGCSDRLRLFCCDPADSACRIHFQVNGTPVLPGSAPIGSDMLMTYYREDGRFYAVAHGKFGPVITIAYDEQCRVMEASADSLHYPGTFLTIDKLLQLIPMRQLLLTQDALLLHASRICVQGSGILFLGKSGIGKTTQRKLWEAYADAVPLSNDRTILRRTGGSWSSYSHLMDGAEPIVPLYSCPVSAIILLEQGQKNLAQPLTPKSALPWIMSQTVTDPWNGAFISKASFLLLDWLSRTPAYRFSCTPDDSAVAYLKQYLHSEGVLPDAKSN